MLIENVRRHPRDMFWLAAWSGVQALPALASGWALAAAMSQFLVGRTADGLGWLGLLAAAGLAGAYGTRQAYLRLGALVEELRDELVGLAVTGALERSMNTTRPPDTHAVARMTHQTEIVRDAYAGVLMVACTFVFTAGSTLAGLVTLVPATLPYVVPPLVCSVLIVRLLLRPFAARQRACVIGEELVANSAAAAASGLRDITACGAQDQVLERVEAQITRQADAARSVARIGSMRIGCLATGGWLPLLLVLGAAPSMLRGGVSAAHIVGVIAYITGSLRSVLYTLTEGVGASMVRLTVTLERIIEASTPPLSALAPSPVPATVSAAAVPSVARGDLGLREVVFGYGEHAEPVIRGLSIDIAPGDHLAIVGPSGIGKSSLAGLLSGMLTPTAGEILLDGVPLVRYPPPSLTRRRVLIPQEAYVFAGTLAQNVGYLCADPPSEAELDAAAKVIGLSPLVSRLGGFTAAVNPAALSGGERQLIALARAYLSAAPIAILDEATCHLDPAAEERAEAAFACRPGTLIVVAHRISSALRAERILVLDGTSARAGDHLTLLASSAMYRELVGYWSAAVDRAGEPDLVAGQ